MIREVKIFLSSQGGKGVGCGSSISDQGPFIDRESRYLFMTENRGFHAFGHEPREETRFAQHTWACNRNKSVRKQHLP